MLHPTPSAVAHSMSQGQTVTRDASALRAAPPTVAIQSRTDATPPAAASESGRAVQQAGSLNPAAAPLFNARLALPSNLIGPKPSFKINLLENLRDELRAPPPEKATRDGPDLTVSWSSANQGSTTPAPVGAATVPSEPRVSFAVTSAGKSDSNPQAAPPRQSGADDSAAPVAGSATGMKGLDRTY